MMLALAIPRDDGQGRGRTGPRPFCGMGSRRAPIDHHQVPPARCIARTSGRGATVRLGRFFASSGEHLNFIALERAGIGAGIAAQVAAQFVTPQLEIPAADPLHHSDCQVTDAAEVVHLSASFQPTGFDTLEASGKDFAVEQKDSASGAKSD